MRRYATSTANTTRYLHRDHLGSVVLITNESGAVTETLAYDAWGKRRPPSTWITPGAGTFLHAQWLRRGFTAHEHIDHVGLIHMGGRVYDPEIGRFLSPDPFVQYPGSAQGMNRYAYVGNNPLSYTDPSGYFIKKFGKALAIVAAVVIPNPIVAGAVAGFLASGGQLKGAIFGAIGGAVFGAIGNAFPEVTFGSGLHLAKTLTHGVAGGLLSAAGGGRFGDGFLGAGVGQLFAPGIDRIGLDSAGEIRADVSARIVRTVTAATVGGTASAIGGGKFANGAISAGFGRAFNDERHLRWRFGDPLPQPMVDGAAGLGDALTLRATSYGRDWLGIDGGVDQSSTGYIAGSWAGVAGGGLRIAYALTAKGYSVLAPTGQAASAFRTSLRQTFRLGIGRGWRAPDLTKYPTDAALRHAAGRTNPVANTYGVAVGISGAIGPCYGESC
ncbi:MAG: RHS repeat-associated core domain-containing protein [Gammaproteobacteria bacterium]|nr:RHS repeat-associated core domain-containing protein [Gammaproteobacteria bacterium]